jgi:hypothetical protein
LINNIFKYMQHQFEDKVRLKMDVLHSRILVESIWESADGDSTNK